uniref:Uncharacterized protein n=1 Tax=Oryzias melastigma TaxID=30732 RepID=A0A3B3D310_ORYME
MLGEKLNLVSWFGNIFDEHVLNERGSPHTSGAFLNDFRTPATTLTSSKLVFLISVLLFFNISSWEKKSHHSFEELVHELDGERHHVHLEKNKTIITI